MLTVFKENEETIALDFLEKAGTVKSDFYCRLLRQNSPYVLFALVGFYGISPFVAYLMANPDFKCILNI